MGGWPFHQSNWWDTILLLYNSECLWNKLKNGYYSACKDCFFSWTLPDFCNNKIHVRYEAVLLKSDWPWRISKLDIILRAWIVLFLAACFLQCGFLIKAGWPIQHGNWDKIQKSSIYEGDWPWTKLENAYCSPCMDNTFRTVCVCNVASCRSCSPKF